MYSLKHRLPEDLEDLEEPDPEAEELGRPSFLDVGFLNAHLFFCFDFWTGKVKCFEVSK